MYSLFILSLEYNSIVMILKKYDSIYMKRLRQAIKEGVKYDNQIMKSIVERLKDTNDDKTKPNNDKPIQTDKEPINVKV